MTFEEVLKVIDPRIVGHTFKLIRVSRKGNYVVEETSDTTYGDGLRGPGQREIFVYTYVVNPEGKILQHIDYEDYSYDF